jgi:hypothetical protein
MEAIDLLCSRNAWPQKALVGRAQWEINQPPSLRDNKRAWRGGARQLAWSLCSPSPHDEAVVARCAQWRPQPAASLDTGKEQGNRSSDARSQG